MKDGEMKKEVLKIHWGDLNIVWHRHQHISEPNVILLKNLGTRNVMDSHNSDGYIYEKYVWCNWMKGEDTLTFVVQSQPTL